MNNNKRKHIAALCLFAAACLCILASCAENTSKDCFICGNSRTKKFTTSNGTARYYCKSCYSKCAFCGEKAKSSYTNLLDFHIFVCSKHKQL